MITKFGQYDHEENPIKVKTNPKANDDVIIAGACDIHKVL